MNELEVLVIGGENKKLHDFSVMGPIFKEFLKKFNMKITLTEDLDMFLPKKIRKFHVILCYTMGRELNSEQEKGLLDAIIGAPWGDTGDPKGFVGVHCASSSFLNSQNYLRMLGGKFLTHPPLEEIYDFKIANPNHPIMEGIKNFSLKDELYLFETYPPFDLLMTSEYKEFSRPITWVKSYGLGRVFYTALGHGEEQIKNKIFQRIIINAIYWTSQKDRPR